MTLKLSKNKNYNISNIKNIWQTKLEFWYKSNKRDLPWRKKENQDFYNIWISEVMLQQTGVKTVIPYFLKFKRKWPDWNSFLDATFDEILFLWQGLGYYQRAKNIYKTLQILKKNKKFIFTHNELIKLPGIGKYSAASISAILKNENNAVVDGNIKRIISRAFNIDVNKKDFIQIIDKIAQDLTPLKGNNLYCQSLMDLGAMICKPSNPKCIICPIKSICSFDFNKKKVRTEKKKINKFGIVFYVKYKNLIYLEKTSDRFLHGTVIFPFSDFFISDNQNNSQTKKKIIETWIVKIFKVKDYKLLGYVKHNFTNFDLKLYIIEVILNNKRVIRPNGMWLNENIGFDNYPFSILMKKVIKKVNE